MCWHSLRSIAWLTRLPNERLISFCWLRSIVRLHQFQIETLWIERYCWVLARVVPFYSNFWLITVHNSTWAFYRTFLFWIHTKLWSDNMAAFMRFILAFSTLLKHHHVMGNQLSIPAMTSCHFKGINCSSEVWNVLQEKSIACIRRRWEDIGMDKSQSVRNQALPVEHSSDRKFS